MMLARKLVPKWWPLDTTYSSINEIPGETISKDMVAVGNTFSIWKTDENILVESALAISMHRQAHEIRDMELVLINSSDLNNNGLNYEQTEGDTIILEQVENHYDVLNVYHKELGILADVIFNAIKEDKMKIVYRDDMLKLLDFKISTGILSKESLAKGIQKQLTRINM